MTHISDKQVEQIGHLIHEAAHLLTLSDAVDLELFQMNSRFDWNLTDRPSCQPKNIIKNFLRLFEQANSSDSEDELHREYSDDEVLEQLKIRISPLFGSSHKNNGSSQDPSHRNLHIRNNTQL